MDGPLAGSAAELPISDDTALAGWDARDVWRERVRDAQLGLQASARSTGTAGWDPVETWRLRVQRPRKPAP